MLAGRTLLIALVSTLLALPAPLLADPPPWAPAYGYRAKHKDKVKLKYKEKHKHESRQIIDRPFLDLGAGRCNRDVIGAVLGGTAGAAIGSQVADGDERLVAVIGGGALGAIVGAMIGGSLDRADAYCLGQALERAPDNQQIVWNDERGARYAVTPTETVQTEAGRYCREYTTTVTVGGKHQQAYGRACRQPDGSWEMVDG